ncbi:MAG: hypothetical protein AAGF99_08785 [Bacteroidota bacterium]
MGQQQLLLLVLGLILVGLAIVVGIESFDRGRQQARYDQKTQKLVEFASLIQAYGSTAEALGGGDDGTDAIFADLRWRKLGLESTSTHNDGDILDIPEIGCYKLFHNTASGRQARVRVLANDCRQGTWEMELLVRGLGADEIALDFNVSNRMGESD